MAKASDGDTSAVLRDDTSPMEKRLHVELRHFRHSVAIAGILLFIATAIVLLKPEIYPDHDIHLISEILPILLASISLSMAWSDPSEWNFFELVNASLIRVVSLELVLFGILCIACRCLFEPIYSLGW